MRNTAEVPTMDEENESYESQVALDEAFFDARLYLIVLDLAKSCLQGQIANDGSPTCIVGHNGATNVRIRVEIKCRHCDIHLMKRTKSLKQLRKSVMKEIFTSNRV